MLVYRLNSQEHNGLKEWLSFKSVYSLPNIFDEQPTRKLSPHSTHNKNVFHNGRKISLLSVQCLVALIGQKLIIRVFLWVVYRIFLVVNINPNRKIIKILKDNWKNLSSWFFKKWKKLWTSL